MKYLYTALFTVVLCWPSATNAQINLVQDACAGAKNISTLKLSPIVAIDTYHESTVGHFIQDNQVGCIVSDNKFSDPSNAYLLASEPLRSVETDIWTTQWVNSSITEYFYNSAEQLSNIFFSKWDSTMNDYSVITQRIRSYNMDNLITEEIKLDYDEMSDSLIYSRRDSIAWQGQVMLSLTLFRWDSTAWGKSFESVNTIEEGLVTENLSRWYNQALGVYVNSSRTFAEYDDMGRQTFFTREYWDTMISEWIPINRVNTTYGDLYSISLNENFDRNRGNTWSLTEKSMVTHNEQMQPLMRIDTSYTTGTPLAVLALEYTYNELGYLTEILQYERNRSLNQLEESRRTFYTPDEDGDLLQLVHQDYENGIWTNDLRSIFTYLPALVSNQDEETLRQTNIEIYPSPSSRGPVNLKIQLEQPSALHVEVYDLLGRRVTTLAKTSTATGTQHLVWEPMNVTAGLYFLRVKVDDSVETRTVTLVR